jgi:hypothetical protein
LNRWGFFVNRKQAESHWLFFSDQSRDRLATRGSEVYQCISLFRSLFERALHEVSPQGYCESGNSRSRAASGGKKQVFDSADIWVCQSARCKAPSRSSPDHQTPTSPEEGVIAANPNLPNEAVFDTPNLFIFMDPSSEYYVPPLNTINSIC